MKRVAVIGSGPAGLMAASTLAAAGVTVTVFEKNKGPGHKLLIAGGSGLNIGNSLPLHEFISYYQGKLAWMDLFQKFFTPAWLSFIHNLGLETFEGTSGRYFVREMKASGLLRHWIDSLESRGVRFHYGAECIGCAKSEQGVILRFDNQAEQLFDAVLLAMGGGSWLKSEAAWPKIFMARGITVHEFQPANCGFHVGWTPGFVAEAANQPLKNVVLESSLGCRQGDIMITEYGIEGTPVYFVGESEICYLDLKPDLSETEILQKMRAMRENLSPLRRAQRTLNLSKAAQALLFHEAPETGLASIEAMARILKKFPVTLGERRPLTEAISSMGGLALDEIDEDFMLKKLPGCFAAGEMLDWHAPTGGFLIQACVSQGFTAAQGILNYLRA